MTQPIIQCLELGKRYTKSAALRQLSFCLEENGIVGLIGRNGSGKTTLMRLCAGQIQPTQGEVRLFGETPMDNLCVLYRLIYSHPNLRYISSCTLKGVLVQYARLFPNFDSLFAEKLIAHFGLDAKRKCSDLSQGTAALFHFICALSCRAPLTMLDEPMLGMDIAVRKEVYEILLRDYAEHPRLFFISSHLLAELEPILTELVLLHNGSLILHQSMEDLRRSAYRAAGTRAQLNMFCEGRNVIHRKNGEMEDFAVILEIPDAAAQAAAQQAGLQLTAIGAEELCIYLTGDSRSGDLDALWQINGDWCER